MWLTREEKVLWSMFRRTIWCPVNGLVKLWNEWSPGFLTFINKASEKLFNGSVLSLDFSIAFAVVWCGICGMC